MEILSDFFIFILSSKILNLPNFWTLNSREPAYVLSPSYWAVIFQVPNLEKQNTHVLISQNYVCC